MRGATHNHAIFDVGEDDDVGSAPVVPVDTGSGCVRCGLFPNSPGGGLMNDAPVVAAGVNQE